MLDIGGWEFLLIVILGVIILGPKELPGAIRNVKLFLRRARELTGEFQSGLDEVARQADLDKVTENLKSAVSSVDDVRAEVTENLDPESEMRDSMYFEGSTQVLILKLTTTSNTQITIVFYRLLTILRNRTTRPALKVNKAKNRNHRNE